MRTEFLLDYELGRVLALLTRQNALILETVLHTGLRISDVLDLRTEQLAPSMWVLEKKDGQEAPLRPAEGPSRGHPGPGRGGLGIPRQQAGDPQDPAGRLEGREAGGQGLPAAAKHWDA